MQIAEAFIAVKADSKPFSRDLKAVEKEATSSAKTISGEFAKVFGVAAFALGLKKSVDAASDLNETVSKTKVIFGDAADEIEATGETTNKSMGLSKRAYLDATSGLKGLLDNLKLTNDQSITWSKDLTALGSDLGSFFNRDPADAIAAISSALRGESEPIRAFNVNINEAAIKLKAMELGLYSGKGAIESNAKAQATLALIMEQTTAAQGDFARTADGVANQQRIAAAVAEDSAASFGQKLLPAYKEIVGILTKLAEGFVALPGPVQVALVGLVGFAVAAGPIGSAVESVKSLTSAVANLSSTAKFGLGAIGLLAAAFVAYQAVAGRDSEQKKETAERAREVASALSTEIDRVVELRRESDQTVDVMTALTDAQSALSAALVGSDDKGKKLAAALGALGLQADDAAVLLGGLKTSQEQYFRSLTEGEAASRKAAETLLLNAGYGQDVVDVLVQLSSSQQITNGLTDLAKDATKGWSDELKALIEPIREVARQAGTTDIAKIAADYLNAEVASGAFKEELVAQAEAQAGASRNGEQASAVLTQYVEILERLTPAQQDQLDGTVAVDEATTELTGAQKKLADVLGDTRTRADDLADASDALASAIDKVFSSSRDLEGAQSALAEAYDELAVSLDENGATLDVSTEAGRRNRESVKTQVDAILDLAVAMVGAGESTDDALDSVSFLTDGLKDQLRAAGLTQQQIEDYIAALGLTPANVTTAVKLAEDDVAKARLSGIQDQLKDIDAGVEAEIAALVEEGKFAEAEAKLREVARDRGVKLNVTVTGGGQVDVRPSGAGFVFKAFAEGGKIKGSSNGQIVRVGEGGGNEVILPLGADKRGRLAELLADPEVSGAIGDVAGNVSRETSAGNVSRETSRSTPGVYIDTVKLGDTLSLEQFGRMTAFYLMGRPSA